MAASSLTHFWTRHWHPLIRGLIIEAGAIPLTSLVIWECGTRKPHPKFLRLCGILGAFAISLASEDLGLLHEPRAWGRPVTGHRGRLWTYLWLVLFGTPMVSFWIQHMNLEHQKILAHASQLGFWKTLVTPIHLA
ncbi:hypothetical protein PCASD_09236 [Puccinia coronata f. sp. avenae]|uniref:Wax synthase domain-containing protein n=1 Tax=Puccinia coronata f. sp. avenae TaxID=200324 RepID=A0A2N5TCI4_9BASI|nr:hypothetical protein PCASD_09236 [Puccinia coronata f. sp. avenae]